MSLYLAGMGWVTPLGSDVNEVWDSLLRGEQASPEKISDSIGEKSYFAFRVPPNAIKNLPPHPRLRRASAISRFAASAGLAALNDAGLTPAERAHRIAIVFAIANGGVVYTKRFYNDIVTDGAAAASPLLFPETVFNAAASHLAAILGITGASYTLVGDGAVGILAMKMAEDLMADEELDYCLVVGAEEADWLLCDAYRKWRLIRSGPPIEAFGAPARGTILSEGAGAVLIGRNGVVRLDAIDAGTNYYKRKDLAKILTRVLHRVANADTQMVIGSANGTFIDAAERDAFAEVVPDAAIYTVKPALGESVAAGTLWQIIVATQALRTQRLPAAQSAGTHPSQTGESAGRPNLTGAIVTACGLNQQVGALRLSIRSPISVQ